MSYYVHLHVVFNANGNDGIAALAKQHLAEMEKRANEEAILFLQDLSQRTGVNPGVKGGLCFWGIVGNYSNAEEFAEVLKPFWLDLLCGDIEGGPRDHHHILVFYEREGSEQAIALEIFTEVRRNESTGKLEDAICIKKHEDLPFAWMQF